MCYLSDGTPETDEGDKNCCINPAGNGCTGAHYVTATRAGSVALASARGASAGADAAATPAECARRVVESVLVKKGGEGAPVPVKWPGNIAAWSGTVSIMPLRIRPPSNFDYIGFRCVREASKR